MNTQHTTRTKLSFVEKQSGVILFFTLVSLLVLSLAAVALIRSVDTNTLIAGNLAFKQATTYSADSGVESGIAWLLVTDAANANILNSGTNPLNQDNAALGYYSSASSAVSLTDGTGIQWNNNDSVLVVNAGGENNAIRYVIQRMCNLRNTAANSAECLFATSNNGSDGSRQVMPGMLICDAGEDCDTGGTNSNRSLQYRITARSLGARNSVSYVQAFTN